MRLGSARKYRPPPLIVWLGGPLCPHLPCTRESEPRYVRPNACAPQKRQELRAEAEVIAVRLGT